MRRRNLRVVAADVRRRNRSKARRVRVVVVAADVRRRNRSKARRGRVGVVAAAGRGRTGPAAGQSRPLTSAATLLLIFCSALLGSVLLAAEAPAEAGIVVRRYEVTGNPLLPAETLAP